VRALMRGEAEGCTGDKVKALRTWLEAWGKDGGDEKPKGKGGGGWGANKPKDDGKDKKAALLTGPPGVGKSTAARLVIHAAGYDMVELNASDVRNKGALQQKVESLTTNQSLAGFFGSAAQAGRATLRKTCLVMDEVDGMSGGDRGGVQELISLIKATRVPIICIANDYYDRKISSLKNHCFDLKFGKPHKGLVVKRLATIAREQGFDVQNEAALEKLFEASNADIRHTINALQTWRLKTSKLEYGSVQAEVAGGGKNQSVMQASVFDVFAEWFLNSSLHKGASLNDRMDMFFFDSDLMPLFVQENYLKTRVTLTAEEAQGDQDLAQLQRFAAAAASISHGDVINNQIRARQRWSLLPSFGVAATVAAGFPVRGVPPGWQTNEPWRRVAFPRALGHMSTTNKKQRLLTDIARCMKMHISANKTEVNCEYLPVLRARLTAPLLERGADGVDEVVALMDEYQLSKEELDSITAELRLADPAAAPDTYAAVDSKVKAALTRKYNKESHGVSFVTANSALKLVKKAKGGRGGEDMLKDLEKESKKELKSLEAAAGEGGGKRNIGRSGDDVEKEGDELEEEDEEEDDERPACVALARPAPPARRRTPVPRH
jgi:replication factor C subunit 1